MSKDMEKNNSGSGLTSAERAELQRLREREQELLDKKLSEREKQLELREASLRKKERIMELERQLEEAKQSGGKVESVFEEEVEEVDDNTNPFSFNIGQVGRRRMRRDKDSEEKSKTEESAVERVSVEELAAAKPAVEVVPAEEVVAAKPAVERVSIEEIEENSPVAEQTQAKEVLEESLASDSKESKVAVVDLAEIEKIKREMESEKSSKETPVSSQNISDRLEGGGSDYLEQDSIVKEKNLKEKSLSIILNKELEEQVETEIPEIVKKEFPDDDRSGPKSFADLVRDGLGKSAGGNEKKKAVEETVDRAQSSEIVETKKDDAKAVASSVVDKKRPSRKDRIDKRTVEQNKKDSKSRASLLVPTSIRNKRSAEKLSGSESEVLDEYVKVAKSSHGKVQNKGKKKSKLLTSKWRIALMSSGIVIAFFGVLFAVLFLIFGNPTDVTFVKYELVLPSSVEQIFKDGDKIELEGSYINLTYSDGSVETIPLTNRNLQSPSAEAGYRLNNGYLVITDWGGKTTKTISINVAHESIKTSFNLVVNKNVLSNLLLLNGGYIAEPGKSLPSFEIFGQFVGLSPKFRKLSSGEYKLLLMEDVESDKRVLGTLDKNDTLIKELEGNTMPAYDELKDRSWWLVARAIENGEAVKDINGNYIEIVVATNIIEYTGIYDIEYVAGNSVRRVPIDGEDYLVVDNTGRRYKIGEAGESGTIVPLINVSTDDIPSDYKSGDVLPKNSSGFYQDIKNLLNESDIIINKVFRDGKGGFFKVRVDTELTEFVLADQLTIYRDKDDELASEGSKYDFVLAKYTDSYGKVGYFVVAALNYQN